MTKIAQRHAAINCMVAEYHNLREVSVKLNTQSVIVVGNDVASGGFSEPKIAGISDPLNMSMPTASTMSCHITARPGSQLKYSVPC